VGARRLAEHALLVLLDLREILLIVAEHLAGDDALLLVERDLRVRRLDAIALARADVGARLAARLRASPKTCEQSDEQDRAHGDSLAQPTILIVCRTVMTTRNATTSRNAASPMSLRFMVPQSARERRSWCGSIGIRSGTIASCTAAITM